MVRQVGNGPLGTTLYIIFCIFVIAVIFLLAYLVPRFMAVQMKNSSHGKNITVLEKIPVSKDCTFVLLKVFDRLIAGCITQSGMTVIKEMDASEIELSEPADTKAGFAEILRQTLQDAIPDGSVKDAVGKFFGKKGAGGDDKME